MTTLDQSKEYEKLALLFYPSIEASGNLYYGQTKKLAVDELFDLNNGGFESWFDSAIEQNDQVIYFCWKLGPLSGKIKYFETMDSLGTEELDNPVLPGDLFVKYKLEVTPTMLTHELNSGKFTSFENSIKATIATSLVSTHGVSPADSSITIDNNTTFIVDAENKSLYIRLALLDGSGSVKSVSQNNYTNYTDDHCNTAPLKVNTHNCITTFGFKIDDDPQVEVSLSNKNNGLFKNGGLVQHIWGDKQFNSDLSVKGNTLVNTLDASGNASFHKNIELNRTSVIANTESDMYCFTITYTGNRITKPLFNTAFCTENSVVYLTANRIELFIKYLLELETTPFDDGITSKQFKSMIENMFIEAMPITLFVDVDGESNDCIIAPARHTIYISTKNTYNDANDSYTTYFSYFSSYPNLKVSVSDIQPTTNITSTLGKLHHPFKEVYTQAINSGSVNDKILSITAENILPATSDEVTKVNIGSTEKPFDSVHAKEIRGDLSNNADSIVNVLTGFGGQSDEKYTGYGCIGTIGLFTCTGSYSIGSQIPGSALHTVRIIVSTDGTLKVTSSDTADNSLDGIWIALSSPSPRGFENSFRTLILAIRAH